MERRLWTCCRCPWKSSKCTLQLLRGFFLHHSQVLYSGADMVAGIKTSAGLHIHSPAGIRSIVLPHQTDAHRVRNFGFWFGFFKKNSYFGHNFWLNVVSVNNKNQGVFFLSSIIFKLFWSNYPEASAVTIFDVHGYHSCMCCVYVRLAERCRLFALTTLYCIKQLPLSLHSKIMKTVWQWSFTNPPVVLRNRLMGHRF